VGDAADAALSSVEAAQAIGKCGAQSRLPSNPRNVFNITRIVDALDVDRSVCSFWCDPPTTAVDIEHFAFHTDALAGLSIFRLAHHVVRTVVSDEFVRRVEEHALLGFQFKKLWPLPEGTNWHMYEPTPG
jgi:hypothetical protein